LAPDDQQDVEEVAHEVLGEVRQAEPGRSKLRRSLAALRGFRCRSERQWSRAPAMRCACDLEK